MNLRTLKWVLALGILCFCASPSFAAVITICTETASGCNVDAGAFSGFPGFVIVASDGEGGFDPFGAGFDTSDGIDLSGYSQFGWHWDSLNPAWVEIRNNVFVLPATTSCGTENEPVCEPVGNWLLNPANFWFSPDTYLILEPNGSIGDRIIRSNTGPGGTARITFESDPLVPEPGTMTLLGFGLLGLGYRTLSRKRA